MPEIPLKPEIINPVFLRDELARYVDDSFAEASRLRLSNWLESHSYRVAPDELFWGIRLSTHAALDKAGKHRLGIPYNQCAAYLRTALRDAPAGLVWPFVYKEGNHAYMLPYERRTKGNGKGARPTLEIDWQRFGSVTRILRCCPVLVDGMLEHGLEFLAEQWPGLDIPGSAVMAFTRGGALTPKEATGLAFWLVKTGRRRADFSKFTLTARVPEYRIEIGTPEGARFFADADGLGLQKAGNLEVLFRVIAHRAQTGGVKLLNKDKAEVFEI
jgi:hypothetical protein